MPTHVRPDVVERWHHIVEHGDEAALDDLIADDAVFYSPAVFTQQEGKALTLAYLRAALAVFTGRDFRYVGEWYSAGSAVLEFTADLDGIHVDGIDMMHWNDAGQITSFKVMIRPVKGLHALMPLMAAQLGQS
ncbi:MULTISPECIES: nuclear transport factor 2 family protein [Rhodococcus]|uniref:nuclear transport factor 2 family protein n=1 Tax=Rhodococcus TaxID=1827 RepID=UPI0019314FE7|nr:MULTISPECIES: nuclear transport factor 2 family protein [Rhodococcus]QRE79304.1 nuclear transport factor 2 family protein [Rhodococcus ruber]WML63081.1 nuclear transport factor 2 family protein [Rhodococcus sp. AH-ZY2]